MLQGLGMETGVDLDALVEVGDYISKHLRRPSHSRVAVALVQKKKVRMMQQAQGILGQLDNNASTTTAADKRCV